MNKLSILFILILIGFGVKAQPIINVSAINANPGDVACVDFTVENFNDIVGIQYSVRWDPTVLQYNSVNNFGLPDLASGNFGVADIGQGILRFLWFDASLTPVNLMDGDLIFSVCFDVIGSLGEASFVEISGDPLGIEVTSSDLGAGDIGIDPTSGGGQVVVGDPLQLCAANVLVAPGGTICVPVTTDDFTDINGFQFSMHYDPAILDYDNFSNVHPSISNLVSNGGNGDITLSWFESLGQGVDIPSGTTLFEVCFIALGTLGQVSDITFDGMPTTIDVTAESSGSTNIGLNGKPGIVTIGDPPTDLILTTSTHTENIGDNVCVDFTVSDFEDVVSMQFSINWDFGVLEFTNVVDNNLLGNSISIGTTNANMGEATVSWFSFNNPVTIPDNSVLFQLCFDVVGFGGDCTDVEISGIPLFEEVVKNNGGGNTVVNINDTAGSVCVIPDPFVLADTTIFHIDCGTNFGTIDVEYSGGVPPFMATWSHGPTTFDVTNLAAGIYTTEVTDAVGNSFMHTFEVFDYTIDPGNCDDGDCSNGVESWDGCECVAGTAPVDPGNCSDGDCTNGEEFWNGCECETGTPPVDPEDCNDGNCANGEEFWNGCECESGPPPVEPPSCDDGDCTNGEEFWNGCECESGPPPVEPPSCDDGDCTNGEEFWNGCECESGPAPVDPGNCDDGICTNGIEEWDGCNCVVVSMPLQGCTNNTATNFDPLATCDDGSCVFPCPDPGNCDNGDCEDGLEVWDGTLCECVSGPPPVEPPSCDDGDCTNGEEFWNGCECESGPAPVDPGNCDDGICTNGIEEWDGCNCVVVSMPLQGCTNNTATNFDPLATCDDGSCVFPCPDPGNCDDGICSNGLEAWDENLCECIIAQSVNLITPAIESGFNFCEGDVPPIIELANTTAGYDVNWYDENMTLVFVGDQFNPSIAGNYFVGLEELVSDCEGELTAFAVAEVAPPIAVTAGAGELNCLISELTLNGIGSDSGAGFTTTWSTTNGFILSGENTLSPTITAGGEYLLTVVDTVSMCVSEATIQVNENFEVPVVAAPAELNLGCDLSIVIDASNSTSTGNISYQWSTIGGNILNGTNTLTPEVNESGTYELVITNNDNFCTGSTTVTVSGTPPMSGAMAGFDEVLCGANTATLEAELSGNMTGFWTISNNGVTISDISDPNASINNLVPGDNEFIWTVSTPDCPDYDQDTVIVSVEEIPETNDDYFEMDAGETRQNFNIGLNDDFIGIDNWNFNFTSNPENGVVTFPGGGIITFEIPANIYGEQQFTYEICNDFCLEYCDSATVIINIPDPLVVIDTTAHFPNTITPNGDGANDFFVLDVLIENPDKYPNNELIIFNRWGNVVYQAQPYNNDWNGVNSKGFDLPQGTYFYVVRLDIAEGDILRGDITILK